MRSFLATLFAAAPAARTTRTRLGVETMEDRYAPALVTSSLTVRSFDPQPEPPSGYSLVSTTTTTRVIIISGG